MRKIGIVTGCRSDWGLLEPLYKSLSRYHNYEITVFSIGPNNSSSHSLPIKADNKEIIEYPFPNPGFTDYEISVAMSYIIGKTSVLMHRHRDMDLLIVLGDRWEIFSFVACAYMYQIPIMHLHAGEQTFGSYDNAFRHSISHMSNYLAVPTLTAYEYATASFRNKFIRRVGGIGLHGLEKIKKDRGPSLINYDIVVSMHPQTVGHCELNEEKIINLIASIKPDARVFSTSQSPDVGYRTIQNRMNIDRDIYLYILKNADVIIGNSSSGIIEAPALGTPTINIGSRQSGRPFSPSVLQVDTLNELHSELGWVFRKKENGFTFNYVKHYDPGCDPLLKVSNWIGNIFNH